MPVRARDPVVAAALAPPQHKAATSAATPSLMLSRRTLPLLVDLAADEAPSHRRFPTLAILVDRGETRRRLSIAGVTRESGSPTGEYRPHSTRRPIASASRPRA